MYDDAPDAPSTRRRLTVNHVRDLSLRPAKTAGGVDLIVRFDQTAWAAEAMEALDATALDATLTHNASWFTNALTPQHINEFFHTSFECVNGGLLEMVIHISASVPPKALTVGGAKVADMDAWIRAWRAGSGGEVRLEIESLGILFEQTRFGVHYYLRTAAVDGTPPIDDMAGQREEAEIALRGRLAAAWDAEVARTATHHEASIAARGRGLAAMDALEGRAAMDASWNAQYATLDATFDALRAGALNYLT